MCVDCICTLEHRDMFGNADWWRGVLHFFIFFFQPFSLFQALSDTAVVCVCKGDRAAGRPYLVLGDRCDFTSVVRAVRFDPFLRLFFSGPEGELWYSSSRVFRLDGDLAQLKVDHSAFLAEPRIANCEWQELTRVFVQKRDGARCYVSNKSGDFCDWVDAIDLFPYLEPLHEDPVAAPDPSVVKVLKPQEAPLARVGIAAAENKRRSDSVLVTNRGRAHSVREPPTYRDESTVAACFSSSV